MPLLFSHFDIDKLKSSLASGSDDLAPKIVELAKVAENAERYEDMCCFMHMRVTDFPDQPLSVDERNYLSVAYKNVIGARRASWRVLSNDLETDAAKQSTQAYKKQIESELETISKNILDLLEDTLITKDASDPVDQNVAEERVFYLKMAGDYYRYLTESVDKDEYKSNTKNYYEKAFTVAQDHLPSTHPIRLGLALNYSVCKYEILKEPAEACKMAKTAFDDAISRLDDLKEADYKDSTLIMQLLRDNLTLWTSSEGSQAADVTVEDLDEDN